MIRSWRKVVAVIAAFTVMVSLAYGPDKAAAQVRSLFALPAPVNMPFVAPTVPLHVEIDRLTAVNFSVKKNVTIMLSNGQQKTVTQYTFTKLSLDNSRSAGRETSIVSANGTSTTTITVRDPGSLGGYDTAGQPETTVLWGEITNMCVIIIIPLCGIEWLAQAVASVLPLTAGATNFRGDFYGIRTTDNHAALTTDNNPVHLPGATITVTP
ncbi:hypothetical protein GCM10027589_33820 [Actinocorallia lasiicapitis]